MAARVHKKVCRIPTSKIVNIDNMYCWLWPRQMTDPSSRQRGLPTSTKPQLSDSNKNLVLGPRRGLTPRLTGRLTVGRNMTLTLTKPVSRVKSESWRLPEPLETKIWSWVPWDSEPRITVQVRASSNLAVKPASRMPEVGVGGYQSRILNCIVRRRYHATTSEVLVLVVVICEVCRLVIAL
jgi:hypothetical protein